MQKVTVNVTDLRVHPAQIRTRLDPEGMAQLALQVLTRGLDADRPIVVADNGDGTYRVVKGHRRWLALMLAEEARRRLDGKEADLNFLLDLVGEFCGHTEKATMCDECSTPVEQRTGGPWCPRCRDFVAAHEGEVRALDPFDLARAYEPLTAKHPNLTVEALLFDGSSEKEEILALQADNFNQEEPDLLGQAHSFAAAVKAGASPREIADNTGLPLSRVEAILALTRVPQELADAIDAGRVPLSIASLVARLRKKVRREGLTRVILERYVTVEGVRKALDRLKDWTPPQVSLDPSICPAKRNKQRIAAALWAEAEKKNPAAAWYIAADYALGYPHRLVGRLAEATGIEDLERWVAEHIPEISCANCQLRDLLADAPVVLYDYPCQRFTDYRDEPEKHTCRNALAPGDPFLIHVLWDWSDLPGVEAIEGQYGGQEYVCRSPKAFRQAVEANRTREAKRQAEREQAGDTFGPTNREAIDARYAAEAQRPKNVHQQRALIRSYIKHHAEMDGADHPTATRCENCTYRLDGSPTKDPTVPHCAWAARRYNVQFFVRRPVGEEKGPQIPYCRQFAPRKPWSEIVPAHPTPPGVPREWMLDTIRRLVKEADREYGVRPTCEWLTGRPFKSSESARGWFLGRLEEQAAGLTDAQLWTLMMWVLAEHTRIRGIGDYLLQLKGGRVVRYVDGSWPFDPESSDAPLVEKGKNGE